MRTLKQFLPLLGLIGVLAVLASHRSSENETRQAAFGQLADQEVYYRRCANARAVGAAPIHAGQPGYRAQLDADRDGIACEPYYGN